MKHAAALMCSGMNICGFLRMSMNEWIKDHPLYLLLALGTMLSAGWGTQQES